MNLKLIIKRAFFLLIIVSSGSCFAMPPEIDINQPVTNMSLINAFENYDADSLESIHRLEAELKDAIFLVPYTPKNFKTEETEEGNTVILPKSIMSFYGRSTPTGSLLVVATDWEAVNHSLPVQTKVINAWVMPAKEVYEWIVDRDSPYNGVEIITPNIGYTLYDDYIEKLIFNNTP